jgi:recombination protein RecT
MMTVKDRLFEGAPRHISAERMITTTLIAIRSNPELLKCEPDSLLAAVRQAAFYGWEIGGVLSQAYLVPFRDNKRGTVEATLIPGYRGLLDLVRRTKEISQIDMEAVHQCDRFRVVKGDASAIYHEPSDDPKRPESPITHLYVIVHFLNGAKQRRVWTASEIDHHKEQFSVGWKRAESNGKKDSPWHTHWVTMGHKTILIDMIKRGLLPVSGEIRDVVQRDEESSGTSGVSLISDIPPVALSAEEPRQIEEDKHTEQVEYQPPDDQASEELFLTSQSALESCESLQEVADTLKQCLADMPEEDAVKLAEVAEAQRNKIRLSRGDKQ